MRRFTKLWAVVLAGTLAGPQAVLAASHREAPITALDRAADITDWYTFVSYDHSDRVTMILSVDPLLEPSNGPTYFPFDPGILYAFHVDNDHDGVAEDVVFEVRFQTELRPADPRLFTVAVGGIAGIPPITALDGPGSEGLGLRQTYTVTMVKGGRRVDLTQGRRLFAVPANAGPRTMPGYSDPGGLFSQGSYTLTPGVKVFAGTTDDPFYIDLGAAFDSLNFRMAAGGGVLSPAQDADDNTNFASDDVSGFNVNTIAIEVPIELLTRDGKKHAADDPDAVLGTYGTTSRQKVTVRRKPASNPSALAAGPWRQVQRMGNPLINELIIGIGAKDRFSMDEPENDAQFASFFLHPILADVFASIGIPVPSGDRTDLLPLVTYTGPIIPPATPAGAIADLLRINTGIPPTPREKQRRLGLLTLLDGDPSNDDPAGFPNGRRPDDDVTDIAARAVAGILADPVAFGTRIGDGVNKGDMPKQGTFPFVSPAHDGRNSRHVDPGEPGCTGTCPVK
ncbi:MAG: DUF4331 domain-containing protein [Acidobacteria bacterium]|nr:MAG: DUF4331 domain-containing protein [Acidobacteriota bacterium]